MKIGDKVRARRSAPDVTIEGIVRDMDSGSFEIDGVNHRFYLTIWGVEVIEYALDPDGVSAAADAIRALDARHIAYSSVAEAAIQAYLGEVE